MAKEVKPPGLFIPVIIRGMVFGARDMATMFIMNGPIFGKNSPQKREKNTLKRGKCLMIGARIASILIKSQIKCSHLLSPLLKFLQHPIQQKKDFFKRLKASSFLFAWVQLESGFINQGSIYLKAFLIDKQPVITDMPKLTPLIIEYRIILFLISSIFFC